MHNLARTWVLIGGYISNNPPSPFLTSAGIKVMRGIRALKKGLEYFFVRILWPLIYPVGKWIIKYIVLPIYQVAVLGKLKLQRLSLPARGFILFFVTNRYLFHFAILIVSTVTIWSNLQARQVLAQDIGKHSLLYNLMTSGDAEIVSEQAVAENVKPGEDRLSAGTIAAIPHIDFDYTQVTDEPSDVTSNMPGTLALTPMDHKAEENATIKPKRQSIETYIVKEGDTLGSIANDYSINVGTILWANNLTERQYIRPGDSLKILPVSGVLATVKKGDTLIAIANRYGADADEIAQQNNLAEGQVKVGMALVVPGGQPAAIEQTRILAVGNSKEAATRLSEPGASSVSVPQTANPTKKPSDVVERPNAIKTKLLWPTSGHVITQYYGWKHTGLDVDGDFTSPLYAAEDGVVEVSGWNSGGYGLMVLIDHPNGIKTRYGHASKLFVKAGDTVHRGQVIAMMGSTGRSTGSHLHFEVYVNGKRVNPLLYIR